MKLFKHTINALLLLSIIWLTYLIYTVFFGDEIWIKNIAYLGFPLSLFLILLITKLTIDVREKINILSLLLGASIVGFSLVFYAWPVLVMELWHYLAALSVLFVGQNLSDLLKKDSSSLGNRMIILIPSVLLASLFVLKLSNPIFYTVGFILLIICTVSCGIQLVKNKN